MNRARLLVLFSLSMIQAAYALESAPAWVAPGESTSVTAKSCSLCFDAIARKLKLDNLKQTPKSKTDPISADAKLVTFESDSGSINVLLVRPKEGADWKVNGEWSVERHDDGDAGSKNETQHWSVENGSVKRDVHRMNVEGIEYTLPCGCCKAFQTRTIETAEETNFTWNEEKQTLDQKSFKKWYVVQLGEGLFSVARKGLGDARLMGKILALNPELKRDAMLTAGQKILIEKE